MNCSFNGLLQPASFVSVGYSSGVIACTSPSLDFCAADGACLTTSESSPLDGALPKHVALRLQVDGTESSNAVDFVYTAVPYLSYIWPIAGVSFESVLIVGVRLDEGTEYQVRFR